MFEEIKEKSGRLKQKIEEFRTTLNIDDKVRKIQQLQLVMAEPDFWNDSQRSAAIIEELKSVKEDSDDFNNLHNRYQELCDLLELDDPAYTKEIEQELRSLEKEIEKFQLKILFQGPFDHASGIVEINSGAGGTEACDWANMLYRMYTRWAQDKGFKLSTFVEIRGEEAGLKNITFLIEGKNVYGLLKAERGVHRLVRISPFDANKRRHTSFASVDVLPEIKDDVVIDVKPEEIRIDTYRASGAGGQHVNRTDSAVRITHLPTGLVVACQNERSQHQNKQNAFKVLKAKLYQLKEDEQKKQIERLGGEKRKIEWGSQIRSYILHPYLMVKDHRTAHETSQAKDVLDGKIDDFIHHYLMFSLERIS
ncbi:MAG: peptide chain release factor 2 [Candidatus Omnitrophica bacterium]|nr:peptide chain release factor 2 [Candidatus Omnitrophota bacterium]